MTPRIILTGSGGMLGKRVLAEVERRGMRAWAVGRNEAMGVHVEASDVLINCAGVIPSRSVSRESMVRTNVLLPHIVAANLAKTIHISTDCVYSGIPNPRMPGRRYSVTEDRPDPGDLYGRSKLAGEVDAPHVVNVRTSFIGPEHGLLAWLMEHKNGAIDGWLNAYWTGSTAGAVAKALVDMALTDEPLANVVHLATEEKLSKYAVLRQLNEHFDLGVAIKGVYEPRIDRALEATWPLMELDEALQAGVM